MARTVTDACVNCGSCVGACPCGAITAGASKYEIDASKCNDCGACEGACPTGAIKAA